MLRVHMRANNCKINLENLIANRVNVLNNNW